MVPLRRRRSHLPRDGVLALRDTNRSLGGAAPHREAPSRADPPTLAARHLDGSRIADSRRRRRGELARSFFGDRLPVPSLFHLIGGTMGNLRTFAVVAAAVACGACESTVAPPAGDPFVGKWTCDETRTLTFAT